MGAAGTSGAAYTAGALSDERDPFRRGQDNTVPSGGELTTEEVVNVYISYPEPITLGRTFGTKVKWDYKRITDRGSSYDYSVSESNNNVHVVSLMSYMVNHL
ncbi:MAG: hypothetical protein WCE93_03085 [Nitrososphaeraceae archaeon]